MIKNVDFSFQTAKVRLFYGLLKFIRNEAPPPALFGSIENHRGENQSKNKKIAIKRRDMPWHVSMQTPIYPDTLPAKKLSS